MRSPRRLLALLGVLAVALVLSSCGVEAGDAATSSSTSEGAGAAVTTTTEAPDRTPSQQAAFDTVKEIYTKLGFTDAEAECLAGGMTDAMGSSGDPTDISAIMDVVNQCDIPMSRFSDIQENLGGGSTSDMFKASLETGFSAMGMTDEQASCVAAAYLDSFGTSPAPGQDPDQMAPIFEQCKVDPSTLKPGG